MIETNKIYCGDCFEIMKSLPDESVEAIITDLPYPKEYIPLYEKLAKEAKRILVPSGSLLVILPHYAIPQLTEEISRHLKWRWMISMWQGKGKHARMAMGVVVKWKPIGWWVKGSWAKGRGFVMDGFESTVIPEKKQHKWEQGIDWARHCLKFVPKGKLVLDPFCGTGTLLVEAKRQNYPYIGIDIEKEYCEIAEKRLRDDK
jgi:DNA modification methylase